MNLDLVETDLTQELAALMAAFEHNLSKVIQKEYGLLLDSVYTGLAVVRNDWDSAPLSSDEANLPDRRP